MVKARLTTEDGITIEVETGTGDYEDALATTLRAIRQASAAAAAGGAGGPTRAQLQQMVEKLSTETLDYLRLLVRNPQGLEDDEITRLLGIENRQKLAGMNGAVTKVAAGVGIPDDVDIIHREMSRGPDGSRTYHYTVPGRVREKLDQVLPEEASPRRAAPPPPSDDDVPF
jgi:hypothetical protein